MLKSPSQLYSLSERDGFPFCLATVFAHASVTAFSKYYLFLRLCLPN